MGENKKYYWLKLNQDFFEDDTMEWLEEQNKDYVIFYLKLCLKSLDNDGTLVRYVGEKLIPYDVKALSKLTNTDKDTVKVAMNLFVEIGLIKMLDTGEIYMQQIDELIGSETESAKRMRKLRAKETLLLENQSTNVKTSQCDNNVQESDTIVHKSDTEIEIEKELDIEIEKDKEDKPAPKKSKPKPTRHKYGNYENVLLTDEQLNTLKNEFPRDWQARIDRLDEYIASTGKSYKNHLATIRMWAKRDNKPNKQVVVKEKVPDWVDNPIKEPKINHEMQKEYMAKLQEMRAKDDG